MHSVDVDLLVCAVGDLFTFAGERDTDWRLDAELNAPAADGLRTLVCEDCDHACRCEPRPETTPKCGHS